MKALAISALLFHLDLHLAVHRYSWEWVYWPTGSSPAAVKEGLSSALCCSLGQPSSGLTYKDGVCACWDATPLEPNEEDLLAGLGEPVLAQVERNFSASSKGEERNEPKVEQRKSCVV